MNDYDLERGFVLRYDEAMKYLHDCAVAHVEQIINGEEDIAGIEQIIDDLYTMRLDIQTHVYEYIKFVECPMSASNINIIPMVEKE